MSKDGQVNKPKPKDKWLQESKAHDSSSRDSRSQTPRDESERSWVLGIPFCRWPMQEVRDWITSHWAKAEQAEQQKTARHVDAALQQKTARHVVTANPEIVMAALQNDELKEALLQADLVTPDGTGIVWAAAYLGKPVAERVAGYDLLHAICHTAEESPFSVYLLGAKEEINRQAADRLAAMYPRLQIVGRRHGYFTKEEEQAIVEEINRLEPDLLLVALGFPKQEIWIKRYKTVLKVKVAIGVGGSFDVLAGKVKRAPKIWQNLRLEWLYRLLQEPGRIRRQIALPRFVLEIRRHKKRLQNM